MPRKNFRVKPYSDKRYKFVVRAKVDGRWRRRYFRDEKEAQAYADQQNRLVPAKPQRSPEQKSRQAERGQAKLPPPDGKPGKPPRIVHYLGGAWRKHLPFAYDLIRELEPSIFVELGVYKGESYFAFCQSVEENRLATRCYGIDTWRGDRHAGLYGPEIGRSVAAYNERYEGFSRLMTMTFREALAHFTDGSIDLLHIDGAHRYEDVKEDFEAWRRKLSSRGVILFHDVTERDRGFGVYKLWQEIARPQASFLFEFGHGLGVWQEKTISRKDPPFLQRLFLAGAETKRAIVEHYATLAETIEADTITQRTLQTAETDLQVYPSRQGAACEEHLSRSRLEPGRWGRLKIELPWGLGDGTAPCRIDPINSTGVVDVAAIRVRSAATGEFLWRASAKEGLDRIVAAGTSFRIPNPRFLRLLSYGPDPQIHLPSLPDRQFQDPLVFDIVLRYELGTEAIDRAVADWKRLAIVSPPPRAHQEVEAGTPSTAVDAVTTMPAFEVADAGKITMVVYSAGESGYSEDRASEVTYRCESWSHLDIALHLGLGTKPLRLDPLPAVGLIDIASMTIRSAINDDVLWRANGGGGLETLQVSGTAVRIPHPHLTRILSYGEDPQIYLPALTDGRFDGPLRLEVWLKTETGNDSIRKGITELATISSSALAEDSETRGLLEQTTRNASSKDTEIESLRAELERAVSERDTARAEIIEERQRHKRTSEERNGQQLHIRELEAIRSERDIELAVLKRSLETVQSKNVSQQARIKNLEAVQREQEIERRALKNSLEAVQSTNANQQAQIENLEAIRREQEIEAQALKKSLETVRSENTNHDAPIKDLETMRGRLESELSAARAELEALTRSFESLRSEKAAQQERIAALEAIRAELESQSARQRESLQSARTETAQFITELEAERVDRRNLQESIKGLEAKQRRSEQAVAALEAALASTQREYGQDLERLKTAAEAANAEVASISAERALVRNELSMARTFHAGTAAELDRVRQQSLDSTNLLSFARGEISRLQNQLLALKNARTELRLKLDSANERLTVQESELQEIRSSIFWKATKPARKVHAHFRNRSGLASVQEISQPSESSSYSFWLDRPVGPSPDGRPIVFAGWVIGPAPQLIYGIQAVAGGKIFPGEHGFERPDVAAAHEDRVGATHAGFSIFVELPPGLHEVSLQVLNNKGEWKEFSSRPHTVNPPPPPHLGALEKPAEIAANDTDLLCVTGWLCFNDDKVTELWATIKGGATTFLTYGLTRTDVAESLPGEPEAGSSGFEGYLPLAQRFSGATDIEVYARLKSGAEVLCFERQVTVRRLTSPEEHRQPPPPLAPVDPYQSWLETNKLTPALLEKMAADARRAAATGHLISVIVPIYNTPEPYLRALIESLKSQIYPKWQLCFADDASTDKTVRSIVEKAALADARIKVVLRPKNGHISKASNSALELAEGEYIGLLDHDDLLTPDALLHIAEAIALHPDVDFLYTDEDKISDDGKRYDPIFKGAFSPEMSLTHNYVQHFSVIRKRLVEKAGGFRPGFEGAQDLDLYLRVMEQTTPGRVRHLPFVCYHWRSHAESTASTGGQKTYVFDSARKSITEALNRRKLRAAPFLPEIAAKNNCCLYQLRWSGDILKENPITIIIPTKGHGGLLQKCIASLQRTVDSEHLNVIVVDDFSEDEETRRYLDELRTFSGFACSVIQPEVKAPKFNFSQLVNVGVAHATTPLVLLLNDDTEALEPGWLEDMAGWMSVDGVGAVGAKLLYPDGTIQHAGVIVGSHGGLAEHIFHRLPKDVIGFNFLTHAARNVTAVTGACLLTSKAAFNSVSGFDEENFAMEYNDVDYCLRLGKAGKRIVFTPQAVLLHHCGKSRGFDFRPQEHVNFLRRYPGIKDAFYNESLDPDHMPVRLNPKNFVHTERLASLKILDISHNLNFEGAPKVSFDRCRYLATEAKCEITVLSHVDGPLRKHYAAAGIEVWVDKDTFRRPDETERQYIERLRLLSARLDLGSFDLIVCSTLVTYWGVLLAKTLDLPVIWFIHESASLDAFFEGNPSLGLIKTCLQEADRVAFEASTTRRLYDRYDERGTFLTLPGSVHVDEIDAFCEKYSCTDLRQKHQIDPSATVITLIGTTCARKGQHVFLQAIQALQAKAPSEISRLTFLMLGGRESPYLDFLRAQLSNSDVQNTVIVPEGDDVYDYYRLSDVFVCASYQESFPRVILEAMAFKLGIVSTNVFGIGEMIGDGHDGFLVSPGDAEGLADRILWLAQNPEGRRLMGDRAHAKVTRLFNSSVQLPKRAGLAKEVVARYARHSRL